MRLCEDTTTRDSFKRTHNMASFSMLSYNNIRRKLYCIPAIVLVLGVYAMLQRDSPSSRVFSDIAAAKPGLVDDWQPVTLFTDVFVYSAYFERNFRDRLRITGAITAAKTADLYCILWYGDNARSIRASVVRIAESHDQRFTAAYFCCYLVGLPVPALVSLADKPHELNPRNLLAVNNQLTPSPRFNISACVSPVHFNPDDKPTRGMVEWFETNKVLGIEFFTVYVHNVSESDIQILNYYESKGILEIRKWSLPETMHAASATPLTGDIHYFGQLTALNDCLYRNKGRSVFTAAMDLDELIVPHLQKDFTLMDILKRLPSKGAYIFRHSYFRASNTFTNSIGKVYNNDVKLINSFQRENNINEARDKSKVIFRPDDVVTVGIHTIWSLVEASDDYVVDPDIGMVHHYKSNGVVPAVVDRATEKYLDIVIEKSNRVYNSLKHSIIN